MYKKKNTSLSHLRRKSSSAYNKKMSELKDKIHVRLGEISSTAIAGNDILSSSLYVSGIAILFAGIYAPIIFILIALVLWLYKHVYTEVVEALPLNGGAYNCLLNATSKTVASIAGVMTILSYVATSVISAKTAAEYLNTISHSLPISFITAGIIIFFAGLVIMGVKDSAKVALGIFAVHVFTLALFVLLGIFSLINSGAGNLPDNFSLTTGIFHSNQTLSFSFAGIPVEAVRLLFLAFAASLLGVSGFESSANFVEEQQRGVFRKTLRNMLVGVAFFNPLIALVILHVLPIPAIVASKDFILADTAFLLGGRAFQYLMVADAFLVLSGAVLTSFVGASGLMYRMTLDHCLPSTILLPKLRSRNTNVGRIIIAFTALCLSILFLTKGNLLSLAGVYTISFLGVMTLFAIGNLVLRVTRPDLKRTYQGPVLYVLLAAAATIIGIIGNIFIDPKNILFFSIYFFPALCLVLGMIYRDYIFEWLAHLTKRVPWLYKIVYPWFEHVTKPKIIVFAHTPDKLFKALDYIRKNETSRNLVIVYCVGRKMTEHPKERIKKFEEYLHVFKEGNVFPHFTIEFLTEMETPFGPDVIRRYANRFRVSLNNVFVGSIHEFHDFSFEDMGGVRIIQ
jgi:amino acid transporter